MIRVRPRTVVLTVVAVLAGCGGQTRRAEQPAPRLPAELARQLATRSDEVVKKLDAGDACGARAAAQQLLRETIAAINSRRVPTALQEPLSAAANDLAARIHCTPAPAAQEHQGKGKGKGKKKHHGEGD